VTPVDNGGLSSITYRAVVDVSGVNGLPLFAADVSANQTYTVTADPNKYVKFNISSRTDGPNVAGTATTQYYSTANRSAPYGPTKTGPVILNSRIDSSGILQIDVSNNGSYLTFAEGLILDGSGILQISYGTSTGSSTLSPYPSAGVFNVTQNDNSAAHITVNFGDTSITNSNGILIIAANSAGSDVIDTL
jgi:hypothetical protein